MWAVYRFFIVAWNMEYSVVTEGLELDTEDRRLFVIVVVAVTALTRLHPVFYQH